MSQSYNIIISGVGGQGVVLVSNVLGEACVLSGKRAISGEMFGLAQRSGSVYIHFRIGENMYSPLIPYGRADIIMSQEVSEALRYLLYLKPNGIVVTNTLLVHPPGESQDLVKKKIGKYASYDDIVRNIRSSGAELFQIDALALAEKAGDPIAENVVMLGGICALKGFPLETDKVEMAVENTVPAKARDINIEAFRLGYSSIKGHG